MTTSFYREKASADSRPLFVLPLTLTPIWATSWRPAWGVNGRGKMALEWHAHTLYHPGLLSLMSLPGIEVPAMLIIIPWGLLGESVHRILVSI